jgi:hypothetical protein
MSIAARPPIMMDGAFVAPAVMDGITDASATRSLRTSRTRRLESTTASASFPIFAVPTGCPKLAAAVRAKSMTSCLLVALGPGTTSARVFASEVNHLDAIRGQGIEEPTSAMSGARDAGPRRFVMVAAMPPLASIRATLEPRAPNRQCRCSSQPFLVAHGEDIDTGAVDRRRTCVKWSPVRLPLASGLVASNAVARSDALGVPQGAAVARPHPVAGSAPRRCLITDS